MPLTVKDLMKMEGAYLPGSAACPGCGLSLSFRIASRVLGKNTVYVVPACCFSVVQSPMPLTSIKAPILNIAFAAAAAAASGIKRVYETLNKDINVVVWAGDGGTADIGLQALSGAAERNEDIIYVCYDNEAYMNTGIQRSGATPKGAWTRTTLKGKEEPKKNVPMIVAAHKVPYVATASVGYPFDLIRKFEKASKIKGFRYIHLLSPCPPGWGIDSSMTVDVAKLATDTYFFPLYEIENGKLRVTVKPPKKRPLKDYLSIQGRFRHLSDEEIEKMEKEAIDWWNRLLEMEKMESIL